MTLQDTGTNFVKTSKVEWNGVALTTTFVSATSLQASVPPANLTLGGTARLSVINPSPGGGATPAFTFNIDHPAPAIASLSPATVVAGSAAFPLTVNGTGYVPSSQNLFNWTINRHLPCPSWEKIPPPNSISVMRFDASSVIYLHSSL
jgi:hypothetical protein